MGLQKEEGVAGDAGGEWCLLEWAAADDKAVVQKDQEGVGSFGKQYPCCRRVYALQVKDYFLGISRTQLLHNTANYETDHTAQLDTSCEWTIEQSMYK